MKQNRKFGLLFILILLIFTISGSLSCWGNTVNRIEFLNNKLEVNVENVSLGSVLSKVQEKTGIEFALDKREFDSIISVRFQSLPIERGLERILNKLNYAVVFGPNGNIQEVIIIAENKKSLKSTAYEGNISSTSNNIITRPPNRGDMKVTPPPDADAMIITPANEDGMKTTPPPDADAMIITPPSEEGMKTTPAPDADAMITTPPSGEGM